MRPDFPSKVPSGGSVEKEVEDWIGSKLVRKVRLKFRREVTVAQMRTQDLREVV